MNATKEEKKKEAIDRMKAIGLMPAVIRQFEKEGLINESCPPLGACYWLSAEQMERVREFEEKNDALVYHCIHSYSTIGEMESYFFVSDYPEEWEIDREDIEESQSLCCVYNLDMPDCSEMGTIGFECTPAAGLVRTW